MRSFPALEYLDVRKNPIEFLDHDLFLSNPKLAFVNFEENAIKHVGFGVLGPLRNLEKAFFNQNPCIDEHFDTNSDKSLAFLNLELGAKCSNVPMGTLEQLLMALPQYVKMEESVTKLAKDFKKFTKRIDEIEEWLMESN